MWNNWQKLATLRKTYPVGSTVHVEHVGHYPIIGYSVSESDRITRLILDVNGFKYSHKVNV